MNKDLQANDNERIEAIAWMRDVLTPMVEVCPLSYQQKRRTARFLNKMPDWLLVRWAESLNVDYIGGRVQYPDMVEKVHSDTGRQLAQQYLEAHDAVPVGNCLNELSKSVVKHAQVGDLPAVLPREPCLLKVPQIFSVMLKSLTTLLLITI